jgi:hypothetical protein
MRHYTRLNFEDEFFSPANTQSTSGVYLGVKTVKGQRYARIKVQSVARRLFRGTFYR